MLLPSATPREACTVGVVFLLHAPTRRQVVRKAAAKCTRLIVAGDEDQAIFTWNGATIDELLSFNADRRTVLPLTHRLPKQVFDLAQNVRGRISRSIDKQWEPTHKKGSIQYVDCLEMLDFDHGEWLILARANYQLSTVARQLRNRGLYFNRNHVNCWKLEHRKAIEAYLILQKGDTIKGSLLNAFVKYSRCGLEFEAGAVVGKSTFNVDFSGHWRAVLAGFTIDEAEYYNAMLCSGVSLKDSPRINIQTIHGAKGGECANVVLFLDVSRKILDGFEKEPDSEHRVFYVGVTRSAENLYIVEPQTPFYYPLLEM